jgi:hypothetical protein
MAKKDIWVVCLQNVHRTCADVTKNTREDPDKNFGRSINLAELVN